MTATQDSDLAAAEIAWDLEPLVDGKGAEGVGELLDRADELTGRLAAARGTIADIDADGLAGFMRDLADLHDAVSRAGSFAMLQFSVDTADPSKGALLQQVQERGAAIETRLVFFELEWAALDDERAEALLADDSLAFCRHHLRTLRRYRDHLLTEPEEKIMTEKGVTGSSAWSRLFGELTSMITVELPGQTVSLEMALAQLADPARHVRRTAAEGVTKALAPGLRTRAFIYNTLLHDKAVDDRLRHYPNWLASRNLANEATDDSVQALVEAVKRRYDIPQTWYALKARMLGVDRLADYDRMASVAESEARVGWAEARETVLDAYASFSPRMADLAFRFFDESWIDAPLRPGKRPGAFCAYTTPTHHPYLFLNWTGKRRDVLTLAHELGHGLHAVLARDQGIFHQATPLTLAETASVFGETVTFGRLLDATDDPEDRLSLLAESIEGAIGTVFRQTAMNQFEDAVHKARRNEGELAVDRIGDLWAQTQQAMLGDAVELTDGYRTWWSYVPHFIGTPGYVYAYAYGQLLALSVYRRYEEGGPGFVPQYLDLLSAGGAKAPEELGRMVGCDLADPAFWDGGLDIVQEQLDAAVEAARAGGRLGAEDPT